MREYQKALNTARKNVEKVKAERDELTARLRAERQNAEVAKNCHRVAVSSLRTRWTYQRTKLENEIQQLRAGMQAKDAELSALKSFADESFEYIEGLEKRIARLERGQMVKTVSQQLSEAISDISEVALVRPDKGLSVEEKMKDLRDGIKDLTKELRGHRENSESFQTKIFNLEEERMLWASDDIAHAQELRALTRSLEVAHQEIFMLRRARWG